MNREFIKNLPEDIRIYIYSFISYLKFPNYIPILPSNNDLNFLNFCSSDRRKEKKRNSDNKMTYIFRKNHNIFKFSSVSIAPYILFKNKYIIDNTEEENKTVISRRYYLKNGITFIGYYYTGLEKWIYSPLNKYEYHNLKKYIKKFGELRCDMAEGDVEVISCTFTEPPSPFAWRGLFVW